MLTAGLYSFKARLHDSMKVFIVRCLLGSDSACSQPALQPMLFSQLVNRLCIHVCTTDTAHSSATIIVHTMLVTTPKNRTQVPNRLRGREGGIKSSIEISRNRVSYV